jgi:hypothetical protein
LAALQPRYSCCASERGCQPAPFRSPDIAAAARSRPWLRLARGCGPHGVFQRSRMPGRTRCGEFTCQIGGTRLCPGRCPQLAQRAAVQGFAGRWAGSGTGSAALTRTGSHRSRREPTQPGGHCCCSSQARSTARAGPTQDRTTPCIIHHTLTHPTTLSYTHHARFSALLCTFYCLAPCSLPTERHSGMPPRGSPRRLQGRCPRIGDAVAADAAVSARASMCWAPAALTIAIECSVCMRTVRRPRFATGCKPSSAGMVHSCCWHTLKPPRAPIAPPYEAPGGRRATYNCKMRELLQQVDHNPRSPAPPCGKKHTGKSAMLPYQAQLAGRADNSYGAAASAAWGRAAAAALRPTGPSAA